ncbi:hypothetical protein PHYBLDRAFT_151981 [Phycomyces blakesleeanus NRRL 1555(-)]|uniref:Uncharacterized protein n=1 Tax=Phycomyces blakesleeanus (strain ATCC 8743b / DSM 1359 / FGSC 10004 / NBRC 33097 / NRRL 1555) TaxID=763407 RepID=A0A167K0Z3_PHYB8|nr:hypothetical protein PHYBLDRAFT_151981 [Phycomyces blakesleeanus NRRL 1555(-)]OAD67036.1 hypothetical protein PHYBLDRAFT_151981 [Phycomyces blakesleeanus NRRL 1555(-)]|eukprot:XP_018285076.1 hypothetical protein PHYBLDRAFT_151981 [Phycomyces blakesleeanus NRRL 1555(-)]
MLSSTRKRHAPKISAQTVRKLLYSGCQSSASNSNKNSQQDLGTNQQLVCHANRDFSDLNFKHVSLELGCVKTGLGDHDGGLASSSEKKLALLSFSSHSSNNAPSSFAFSNLSSYSPELNPIEQFWPVVKSNASSQAAQSYFEGSSHYSATRFEDYFAGQPI